MLGTLAAIALIIGGISSTVVLTEEDRLAAEEANGRVVEIQTVKSADTPTEEDAVF